LHHTKIVLGGIFNAQANHSPLVITAGQQSRSLMTLQANLTNRDAARMPHPLVKFSYEPPRAEDVPLALARAVHLATLPPLGPVFVSIPMDDWDRELEDPATVALNTARTVTGRAAAGPDDAIVADGRLTVTALLEQVGEADGRPVPEPRPGPEPPDEQDPMSPSAAVAALADVIPDDAIIVLKSPSATLAVRNRIRLNRPGSYFFGAGGGLGFGLSAAVGVQLAHPDRPVVCVVGEGSAQYAIQALWAARAYDVPLTVLVLRNEEYAILKWFATLESVEGVPGLDLPRLDTAAVAQGYGVDARVAGDPAELREALQAAIGSAGPALVETRVALG